MRLKSALKCENEKSGAIRIGPDLHLTILENMDNFHDAKITKTGQSVAPGPAHVQTFDMTMKDSSLQRYKKSGELSQPAGLTKVKNVSICWCKYTKKSGEPSRPSRFKTKT